MRYRAFYLGLLVVTVLLGVMTTLGCGTEATRLSFTPADGSNSSSSAASASTIAVETTPIADVPLSRVKASILQLIQQIRAGLADGTWVFDPEPFYLATTEASDPDIRVYLKDSATDITVLEKEIAEMPQVARVSYVSKDEALAQMKEDFKDTPEVISGIQGNPLPASLKVWLKDRSQASVADVVQKLQGRAEVHEIDAPALTGPPDDLFPGLFAQELLDEAEQTLYLPDVRVYLKASAGEATGLYDEIAAIPEVAKVNYISSEEAMARLKNDFKDNPEILAGLETNVLPGSFELWLQEVSQSESLVDKLRTRPEVDEAVAVGIHVAEQAEWILSLFHPK